MAESKPNARAEARAKKEADEKRLERRLDKFRESESRWLQKTLFALGKARHARDQLKEATGKDLDALIELEDGTLVSLDDVEERVEQRIDQLMEALGQNRYGPRAR